MNRAETQCVDGTALHEYRFAQLVYSFNEWPIPGSGARERYLEDKFTCSKCLHTRYANKRTNGNSYDKPIEGSVPK